MKYTYNLIILGFTVLLFFSCATNEYKKEHSVNYYLNNTEPLLKAWIEADTMYLENYINTLANEKDKNIFYSELTDFYSMSNRVIIAFDDSCQGENHFVFNDLVIDSNKELMNKDNAINGLKTYMKSKLLFRCNLKEDSLESILNTTWKKCKLMTEKDFEALLLRYNNYANTLTNCDTCEHSLLDSTISYIRCPR